MVARPAPCRGLLAELGTDRIEVNVTEQFLKIGVFLAEDRLVPALKKMADAAVAEVKVLHITGEQSLHDDRERELRYLDEEVEVVRHQTVGVSQEWSFLL